MRHPKNNFDFDVLSKLARIVMKTEIQVAGNDKREDISKNLFPLLLRITNSEIFGGNEQVNLKRAGWLPRMKVRMTVLRIV